MSDDDSGGFEDYVPVRSRNIFPPSYDIVVQNDIYNPPIIEVRDNDDVANNEAIELQEFSDEDAHAQPIDQSVLGDPDIPTVIVESRTPSYETDDDDSGCINIILHNDVTILNIRIQTFIAACVVAVIAILITILLPISFAYLDYTEIGLKEHVTTGFVDDTEPFDSGRYLIGPSWGFRAFNGIAHLVEFTDMGVFTSDQLRVTLDCSFQYLIKLEELGELNAKFDKDYQVPIKHLAGGAIANAASKFSTKDYYLNRLLVEQVLHEAVILKLEGAYDCCEPGCIPCHSKLHCDFPGECSNCSMPPDCNNGNHVIVPFFQLGKVDIPDQVTEKMMSSLLLQVAAETEYFKQIRSVTIRQTEAEVDHILRQAVEVDSNSTAHALLIEKNAKSRATGLMEEAHIDGLQTVYEQLSITDPDHKASVNLFRSFSRNSNIKTVVGYGSYYRLYRPAV